MLVLRLSIDPTFDILKFSLHWGFEDTNKGNRMTMSIDLFCLCPLDLTIKLNFNRSVPRIATSAKCDTDIPRFNDFSSLCAFSESSLTTWLAENTKRILCACSENWTHPEVAFLCGGQKEPGLWEKNAVLLFLQWGYDFVWLPGVILNPRLMAVSTLCLRLCFLHTRNKLSHLLCVPKFEFFEAHFL